MGKAYTYFFYKCFRFWEFASTPKFWSDWKASLTLDIFWCMLALSGCCYYTVLTHRWINFDDGTLAGLAYVILIVTPNYFLFHHKARWKKIVKEFDQLPKKKNQTGNFVAWGIVFVAVGNLIVSFFLLSLVNGGK